MSVYACNPEKNVECSKRGCWLFGGECWRTTRKECAVVLDGMPVEFDWQLPEERRHRAAAGD